MSKIFDPGKLGELPVAVDFRVAGMLELIGGTLLIGLAHPAGRAAARRRDGGRLLDVPRPAELLAGPQWRWGSAIMFCFIFLFFVFRAGAPGVDCWWQKRRGSRGSRQLLRGHSPSQLSSPFRHWSNRPALWSMRGLPNPARVEGFARTGGTTMTKRAYALLAAAAISFAGLPDYRPRSPRTG